MQLSISEVKLALKDGHAVITGWCQDNEKVFIKLIPTLQNAWAFCDEEFKQLNNFYSTI